MLGLASKIDPSLVSLANVPHGLGCMKHVGQRSCAPMGHLSHLSHLFELVHRSQKIRPRRYAGGESWRRCHIQGQVRHTHSLRAFVVRHDG